MEDKCNTTEGKGIHTHLHQTQGSGKDKLSREDIP